KAPLEYFFSRNGIELFGIGIYFGVGFKDSVYASTFENDVGFNFDSPQRGGRISSEVGIARSGAKDDHPAFFEVANSTPPNIRLGDFFHPDSRHQPGVNSSLFQGIL